MKVMRGMKQQILRAGAANTVDPDKANCFIALQLIRKSISDWLHDEANKVWHKTSTAKHSTEVIRNFSSKRTYILLDLNRSEIQRIVAFSTGHGKFNAHLKKMSVSTDAKCKYCEEEETAITYYV